MSVTLFTTETAWQWGQGGQGEGEGEEVPWLEGAVFVVAVALVTI